MRALLMLMVLTISGCATNKVMVKSSSNELDKFAYANCLMWYLESKGYDSSDVRSISGGIVEKSDFTIDRFQQIALAVKEFQPDMRTKNDIDINILKCFHLENSEDLKKVLGKL